MITGKDNTIPTLKTKILLKECNHVMKSKRKKTADEDTKLMVKRNQLMIETVILNKEQMKCQIDLALAKNNTSSSHDSNHCECNHILCDRGAPWPSHMRNNENNGNRR